MNAIFTRTSTRQFDSRKVEHKYIIKLIRAAMSAPSAKNQQPWEFYITEDKNILSRLAKSTPYASPAGNAPSAIILCYYASGLPVPEMVLIDMGIAAENILLEAEALGLGAVMIGVAPIEERMKAVADILHIPDTLRAFTIIPVGYPLHKREQEDRYEPSRVHTV